LVFNTRRPLFADQQVRKALNLLFNFEWTNKELYHGAFARLESYYDNSSLSAHGVAANDAEKTLLKPFPDAVTPEAMAGSVTFPVSQDAYNRANTHAALELLKAAGWELKNSVLTNTATGAPFAIEVLAQSRTQERLLLTYANQLKTAGISAQVRLVDAAQYQQRLNTFNFDMIQYTWYTSLSPGNEQIIRWASKAADAEGSFNLAGIKNPAADAMIDALIRAKTEDELVAAMRALDRVLLSGDYTVPLFYPAHQWVAYRSHLRYPAKTSLYGYLLDTWWADPNAKPSNP
jgi:peptide/nickel transport system substrate-binding protein